MTICEDVAISPKTIPSKNRMDKKSETSSQSRRRQRSPEGRDVVASATGAFFQYLEASAWDPEHILKIVRSACDVLHLSKKRCGSRKEDPAPKRIVQGLVRAAWHTEAEDKLPLISVLEEILQAHPEWEQAMECEIHHFIMGVVSGNVEVDKLLSIFNRWKSKRWFQNSGRLDRICDLIEIRNLTSSIPAKDFLPGLLELENMQWKSQGSENEYEIIDSEEEETVEPVFDYKTLEMRWKRMLDVFRQEAELQQEGDGPWFVSHNLFLGNMAQAQQPEMLKKLGIKAVLNVTGNELPQYDDGILAYMHVPATDDGACDIVGRMLDCMSFIDKHEAVMVHCHEGINRSSAVIVAYMMLRNGFPLSVAFRVTCNARNRGLLKNEHFCIHLIRFARFLDQLR